MHAQIFLDECIHYDYNLFDVPFKITCLIKILKY